MRRPILAGLRSPLVAWALAVASQACEPTGPQPAQPAPESRPAPPANPTERWIAIHIEDDQSNPTLTPCAEHGLKTPGADIDAAALYDGDPKTGGNVVAYLDGCTSSSPQTCDNDAAQAASAEGEADANDQAGFVSLNGGCVSCSWSGGFDARPGDFIEVIEVGAAAEAERYRIRFENAAGGKSSPSELVSGGETVPVAGLIQ